MTPADLELAVHLRALFRHPLVREELKAILAEVAPAASARQEGFISTSEAARRWGVQPDTVLAAIADGRLPATRPPGSKSWRIRPGDLEAFLAGQDTGTPPVDLSVKRAERVRRLTEAARRPPSGGR